MKAIIEFNLPEEQLDFDRYNQSSTMYYVLWEMKQWLRNKTKYAINDSDNTAYYECQDKLNELLNDNNIEI